MFWFRLDFTPCVSPRPHTQMSVCLFAAWLGCDFDFKKREKVGKQENKSNTFFFVCSCFILGTYKIKNSSR